MLVRGSDRCRGTPSGTSRRKILCRPLRSATGSPWRASAGSATAVSLSPATSPYWRGRLIFALLKAIAALPPSLGFAGLPDYPRHVTRAGSVVIRSCGRTSDNVRPQHGISKVSGDGLRCVTGVRAAPRRLSLLGATCSDAARWKVPDTIMSALGSL